ncbi:DNA polymerase epsilon subunit 1 [Enteropsectra breve]|nr:DNA polymerase epsilon subunit 1 [Enteropsectra breve]
MQEGNEFSTSEIEKIFMFDSYYDSCEKDGWLLNYKIYTASDGSLFTRLYFVAEDSSNFTVSVPYFPSFLISSEKLEEYEIEEFVLQRHKEKIQRTEKAWRIDPGENNHLNKRPGKYLKVFAKNESAYLGVIRELKNSADSEQTEQLSIHEYDIPTDVCAAVDINVCCGKWYGIRHNGCEYQIVAKTRVTYPDLRIMAFDIETTKMPLKFPNAEFDQIMMISIMSNSFGHLIVNRECVSQDIKPFEYVAKQDMKCFFEISNENDEKDLISRFINIIQEFRPHIISSYNGAFFDWPFVNKRALNYGISLEHSIGYTEKNDYFDSPFILHMDCYKWVKRDSYLPMGNQGLKEVSRIKLGYFPDEIDPEDMVMHAQTNPQLLASYSVSDALATYYLYIKFVHSHIFSICSIIPLPTIQILCKGSGTLCEALLFSEALSSKILVPEKMQEKRMQFYNGHIVENLTYVGGHVESLHAGIFRADLNYDFKVEGEMVDLITAHIDDLLADYLECDDYEEVKQKVSDSLSGLKGDINSKASIYHLDVGAMYPNIILTNRIQPIAVVDEDVCIHCDFNKPENMCKRKLEWTSRAEYIPTTPDELSMIKHQLMQEKFEVAGSNGTAVRVPYRELSQPLREEKLRERAKEYAKKIYKKAKIVEEQKKQLTICQREVPFYVDTVRKFRDQRNLEKRRYKQALFDCEKSPTSENEKRVVIHNSLQIAYKCVLNSFYGYVMRTGSRWFSLEMAAAVCNTGGKIIKMAKQLVEAIGTPLELDTDGIWCMLPESFPCEIQIGNTKVPFLANILNYFVCKKFTNTQYQVLNDDKKYEMQPQNSIAFEADGPYKAMVLPSSTDENRLLKKRYAVFDFRNKITELKGFELKRRGELNIIKKFQEDLFSRFTDGDSLQQCYNALAEVCEHYLDIIDEKADSLNDETVFHLFSESRSMSKDADEYKNKKSNILGTAEKMAEFLGRDILTDKLKCEFIISRHPENAPIASRAIPVLIFKHPEKKTFLKKWLKCSETELKKIIDWQYYRKRMETIIQRMVVIPAHFQGIAGPVPRIEMPKWVSETKNNKLYFASKTSDIEGCGTKNYKNIFFSKYMAAAEVENEIKNENTAPTEPTNAEPLPEKPSKKIVQLNSLKKKDVLLYIKKNKSRWRDYYAKSRNVFGIQMRTADNSHYMCNRHMMNGSVGTEDAAKTIYISSSSPMHFSSFKITNKYLPGSHSLSSLSEISLKEKNMHSLLGNSFFSHFSIQETYNDISPVFDMVSQCSCDYKNITHLLISSFIYQSKTIYCLTLQGKTKFLSEFEFGPNNSNDDSVFKVEVTGIKEYLFQNKILADIVLYNKNDRIKDEINTIFPCACLLEADIIPKMFIGNLDSLKQVHLALHGEMKEEFIRKLQISELFEIPLMNINRDVIDLILFKEYAKQDIVVQCQANSLVVPLPHDEIVRPGYHPHYCVQLELQFSLVLAIIEHQMLFAEWSGFDGTTLKEFLAIRNILKRLVIAATKNDQGASSLIKGIAQWLKQESILITEKMKEIFEILQKQYLSKLISHLKELQVTIVSSSLELLIVATGKNDSEGCARYLEYLKNKIAHLRGYELLSVHPLRTFEKLVFVDSLNYWCKNGNEIFSFADQALPQAFLSTIFSVEEISNDMVYDMVRLCGPEHIKIALKMISFRREIYGVAGNCYKLLRISGFQDKPADIKLTLKIFCEKCGFENIVGRKCLKCHSVMAKGRIEKAAEVYLGLMKLERAKNCKSCSICKQSSEKKLKEHCKCGGRLVCRSNGAEVLSLKAFVNTPRFDEAVEEYLSYF